jgi:hypothetical protein
VEIPGVDGLEQRHVGNDNRSMQGALEEEPDGNEDNQSGNQPTQKNYQTSHNLPRWLLLLRLIYIPAPGGLGLQWLGSAQGREFLRAA